MHASDAICLMVAIIAFNLLQTNFLCKLHILLMTFSYMHVHCANTRTSQTGVYEEGDKDVAQYLQVF